MLNRAFRFGLNGLMFGSIAPFSIMLGLFCVALIIGYGSGDWRTYLQLTNPSMEHIIGFAKTVALVAAVCGIVGTIFGLFTYTYSGRVGMVRLFGAACFFTGLFLGWGATPDGVEFWRISPTLMGYFYILFTAIMAALIGVVAFFKARDIVRY